MSLFNKKIRLLVAWLFIFVPLSESEAGIFKVVIDPGHGGLDEGTVFLQGRTRIAEKDITLKLSRQIASHLLKKGFQVTLTRSEDHEVPLAARTSLANHLRADLFISIHMNSTANSLLNAPSPGGLHDPEGIETYILNNATDASSRRLAHLENSVISIESAEAGNSPQQWDVALILKDLRIDGNLSESKQIACTIQDHLVSATSQNSSVYLKRNRGVKQALFHVLLGADMPSVLVETGFLSNPRDRFAALSLKGQLRISRAIANAIDQYRYEKKRGQKPLNLTKCKIN